MAQIPFMGEEMVCIMSGEKQMSDPTIESGWDCVIADGRKFYVSANWREKSYKKIGYKYTWVQIMAKVVSLYQHT